MEKIPTSKNITAATIARLRGPALLTNWNKTVALLIPVVNEGEARAIFQLIQEYNAREFGVDECFDSNSLEDYGGGLGSSIDESYHENTQGDEKGSKKCRN
jgi:hypothetical protein